MTLPDFLLVLRAKTLREAMTWEVLNGQYVRTRDGHCFLSYLRDDIPTQVSYTTAARIATAGDGNGEIPLRARLMRAVGLPHMEGQMAEVKPMTTEDLPGTPTPVPTPTNVPPTPPQEEPDPEEVPPPKQAG